ncbi:MAG: hypothetical protein JXR10_02120 [Cyclobacteriaceae bacterium]
MDYRIGAIFLASLFLCLNAFSQKSEVIYLGGPRSIIVSDQLPENITSERSLIVIDTESEQKGGFETRGEWKTFSQTLHKSIRRIGLDPIAYIHASDLFSGPEAKDTYRSLLELRQVKNIIHVRRETITQLPQYTLTIFSFSPTRIVQDGAKAYTDTNNDLGDLLLKMGRQVLRQELVRSNFLIPESPEYLEDLPLFTGQKFENYPSRLRSQKLAVVAFPKTPTEDIEDESVLDKINEYNQEVDRKNQTLNSLMSKYPYKFELTTETNIEALYNAGFQYVLMPLSSSSESVKQMLNYPTIRSETHHMTNTFNVENQVELQKIPVDSYVTKYYIKQTIVKDIHTGKFWDAGVTWEKGLENFIFNLNQTIR